MSRQQTIVVTGATGSVGGQVLAQVAARGVRVRAVGRDPATLGPLARRYDAAPYVADLTDPATVEPALDGADAAFLVFPSVAGDAAAPELVAALTAHVGRVVYLSAHGVAEQDEGGILGSHALLERLLRESAGNPVFLRASGFATNTLAWAEQTRRGDEVRWFGPRITRSLVHEADLAAVGVRALLDDGLAGTTPHLTGPEQLTQEEQVAAIGAAIGRPLRFVDVGDDHADELFPGMPADVVTAMVRAQSAMAANPEPVTGEVERILGRPARTYERWAADHREDFR